MSREDRLKYNVQDYRKKRVIIDTDAACEADDPFAIVHALMSKMLVVKGIMAEHFVEPGSMEASYQEIDTILRIMGKDVPILRGCEGPLSKCSSEISEASQFLIEEALREDDMPLYVLCIGATTNVAAAIRKCPMIAKKITIVSIGGNPYEYTGHDSWEFNFGNDVEAANIILHSGGEVWQIPNNVYGTMHIGFAEIQKKIYPYGKIGKHLYENLIDFYSSDRAAWSAGESWSLGDSPAVGVTLEPNCGSFSYKKAPTVLTDTSYEFEEEAPLIRVYNSINSRFILEDFICKLQITYAD